MPRFVILRHKMPAASERPDHWDLMLATEEALATWEVIQPLSDGGPIVARKLADHRKAYLQYEGPVSRDRGEVTQWDSGEYQTVLCETGRWEVDLSGQRIKGRLTLVEEDPATQRWLISLSKI